MPHCYGYRFSYTLDVVWNTGPLTLAEVSSIRNNLIFAKKFILFILTTLVIIWVLIISKQHFYHMHVKHLDNDNTNEQPLRKKPIFFGLCQTSLHSSRASSVKRCRKNTYEIVTFNFHCTVSKFYCTYFTKVFHKTMKCYFLE